MWSERQAFLQRSLPASVLPTACLSGSVRFRFLLFCFSQVSSLALSLSLLLHPCMF